MKKKTTAFEAPYCQWRAMLYPNGQSRSTPTMDVAQMAVSLMLLLHGHTISCEEIFLKMQQQSGSILTCNRSDPWNALSKWAGIDILDRFDNSNIQHLVIRENWLEDLKIWIIHIPKRKTGPNTGNWCSTLILHWDVVTI